MTRPLAAALGLLALSAAADAQQPPRPPVQISPPGYIAIRVRLGSDGTVAPAQPGMEQPGPGLPGAGAGGPGGGRPGRGGGGLGPAPGGLGPAPGGLGPAPGGPGGPGMPGPGGPGFPGAGESGTVSSERSIVVTIPHKGVFKRLVYPEKRSNENTNPMWEPVVRTEYGETLLLWDSPPFQGYKINLPTLADDLKRRHDKEVMTGGARRNELMFDLIRQAVEWNQLDQAVLYAKELVKWAEAKDAKPDAVPARMAAFLKAFQAVEPKLSQPLAPPADADKWRERLNKASNVASSNHYALVNYGEQAVTNEGLNRRLDALERNFKAFYLLHALQGTALPFPERQLLAVLVPKGSDLPAFADKLGGGPISADAFYSPAHNILVLSPDRSDEMALGFLQQAKAHYKDGWNRAELLKGKAPNLDANTTVADVARLMTYALVDLALEDEAITAAVTREGSRQLYAAVGPLPKYVQLPQWVESGVSSLLQKPKDPGLVTVAGKPSMTLGIGAGYGSANYVLLRQFREFHAAAELPAADELLARVLTDKYFDAWRNEQDLDKKPAPGNLPGGLPGGDGGFPGGMPPFGPGPGGPGGPALPGGMPPVGPGGQPGGGAGIGSLGGNSELAQFQPPGPGGGPGRPGPGMPGMPGPGMPGMPGMPGGGGTIESGPPPASQREAKAQATAWALVYYLTRTQDKKWGEFVNRLNRMPRDMKLDKQLVLREFCLTFNLTKAGETDPTTDPVAFKQFGETWVKYILAAPASWRVEKVRADQPQNPAGGPGGGPGMPPGGPGGFPGAPGGPGGPGGGGSP